MPHLFASLTVLCVLFFPACTLAGKTEGKPAIQLSKIRPGELARALPTNWPLDLAERLRDKRSDDDLAKELGLVTWAFDVHKTSKPFHVWLDIAEGEVGEPHLKRRFPLPGAPELTIEEPGRLLLAIGPRYSERMLKILTEARGKSDAGLRYLVDLELWHQAAEHTASFSKAIGVLWFDMKDKTLTVTTPPVKEITVDEVTLLHVEAIEKVGEAKKAPWKVSLSLKARLAK